MSSIPLQRLPSRRPGWAGKWEALVSEGSCFEKCYSGLSYVLGLERHNPFIGTDSGASRNLNKPWPCSPSKLKVRAYTASLQMWWLHAGLWNLPSHHSSVQFSPSVVSDSL